MVYCLVSRTQFIGCQLWYAIAGLLLYVRKSNIMADLFWSRIALQAILAVFRIIFCCSGRSCHLLLDLYPWVAHLHLKQYIEHHSTAEEQGVLDPQTPAYIRDKEKRDGVIQSAIENIEVWWRKYGWAKPAEIVGRDRYRKSVVPRLPTKSSGLKLMIWLSLS